MSCTTRPVTLTLALLIAWSCSAVYGSDNPEFHPTADPVTVQANSSSGPLTFTENQGQWPDSILFQAHTAGATIWFTSNSLYQQFIRYRPGQISDDLSSVGSPLSSRDNHPDSAEILLVRRTLEGVNPTAHISGQKPNGYYTNYFLGGEPSRWRSGVPSYQELLFEEIYPGIDLRFYGRQAQIEYDFVIAPGADYHKIRFQYDKAVSLGLSESGDLLVENAWGTTTERAPVIYQEIGGARVAVAGNYAPLSDDMVGFELTGSYRQDIPLIIDPVLVYSTYLGGDGDDCAWDVAVDTGGCALVTGWTWSADFPTWYSVDADFNGGVCDMFVTKFNAAGDGLVYSTYLGGNEYDFAWAIALDRNGCAYLAGHSTSDNFPTCNAYAGSLTGAGYDAVAVKLNSSGDALVYSSYLGGSGKDWGLDVAVDTAGCAYVTGYTQSADFPIQSPLYSDLTGETDAFVTKFDASGSTLIYSTHLGGSDTDQGTDIVVDSSGCAYIIGYTRSSDFPTANPFCGVYAGGTYYGDAFVTKLNPAGDALVYSTYLGGAVDDMGNGIAIDRNGCAYVVGYTKSTDFPLHDPFDDTYAGGVYYGDGFVTKLNSTGDTLVYSTYLGGHEDEWGYSLVVDQAGCAYVAGHTKSHDFPVKHPYDNTLDGYDDATLTAFNTDGRTLIHSTYFGGSSEDYGRGIALDDNGCIYIAGYTYSSDFPTLYSYDSTYGGFQDAFLAKFCAGCCVDRVGDADQSGDDEPTIADISVLIDAKFITGACEGILSCLPEADINQSGGRTPSCDDITISDISVLIDYLFITGQSLGLPACL